MSQEAWAILIAVFAVAFALAVLNLVFVLVMTLEPDLHLRHNRRPPVPVPPLPRLESMADGLHVRVREARDGDWILFYRPEVWRGNDHASDWPGYCDTEEQARSMGEEWICRIRANKELKAAGQHEAVEMVWSN